MNNSKRVKPTRRLYYCKHHELTKKYKEVQIILDFWALNGGRIRVSTNIYAGFERRTLEQVFNQMSCPKRA